MNSDQHKKKTSEEILEEARKLIGTTTKPIVAKYPVEYEPIARYCKMVDDSNPLFLDSEYAQKTKHASVFLPPLAVFPYVLSMWSFSPSEEPLLILPPTPGNMSINMSLEVETFRPAFIGDRLTAISKLADVYIKKIVLDPKAFWIIHEITISNQKGEVVWRVRNLMVIHRSPEQVMADSCS